MSSLTETNSPAVASFVKLSIPIRIEEVWGVLPAEVKSNPVIRDWIDSAQPKEAIARYKDLFWYTDGADRRRIVPEERLLLLMLAFFRLAGGEGIEEEAAMWLRIFQGNSACEKARELVPRNTTAVTYRGQPVTWCPETGCIRSADGLVFPPFDSKGLAWEAALEA